MALATHHVQGSYISFSRKPISQIGGIESKQYGITLPMWERNEKFISLECKRYLRIRCPHLQPKVKLFKISSFKGSSENEESSGIAVQSKSLQNSVKLSYVPQKSEEILTESPKFQEGSVSSASDVGDTSEGLQAIQNLFRSWLTSLRTPSPDQGADKALEKPLSETLNGMERIESGGIFNAFWCSFLSLDAMIKIPLVIFTPSYLAINVIYGAEVSKELTPLWVFGPLICALYIKIFRAICALYVYSFKQTVKVVKNLPTYYRVVYSYTAGGKLMQPVVNIKNLDYKEVLKGRMKDFSFWIGEKYLDFIESIWPYYCRILRFLKRANLI